MNKAERESLSYVNYTCPKLDGHLDDLLELVVDKLLEQSAYSRLHRNELLDMFIDDFSVCAERIKDDCTKPLREALIEVIENSSE